MSALECSDPLPIPRAVGSTWESLLCLPCQAARPHHCRTKHVLNSQPCCMLLAYCCSGADAFQASCALKHAARQRATFWPCRALEEHGVVSYGEVTRHTLGRSGQRLVDTLLIISQTGAASSQPHDMRSEICNGSCLLPPD